MKKKGDEARENERTMQLPVPLTDAEYRIKSAELASAVGEEHAKVQEIERWARSAKATKEDLESDLDMIQAAARDLATVVRTRKHLRGVTVFDRMDFEAAAVHTVREDTGEVVSTRGMSEADRQRGLFTDANKAAAGAIDAAKA